MECQPGVQSSSSPSSWSCPLCQHSLLCTSASPDVAAQAPSESTPWSLAQPVHGLHQPSPGTHWMAKQLASASHHARQALSPAASLPMPATSCHSQRSRWTPLSSVQEPDIEQAQHWELSEHIFTFLLRVTQWPAWSSHGPPSHSPYSRADEQPAGQTHAPSPSASLNPTQTSPHVASARSASSAVSSASDVTQATVPPRLAQ
mmetsp:Transcript_814/g.2292  ORF Transcript_814/g.2292 Transcript_814/m.2292 type:complete len:203 (-) Transcript_814:342-950(-)